MSLLDSLFSTHGRLLGAKESARAQAMQPLLERIQAMEAERQRAQQAQAGQDQLEAYRGFLANPDLTPAGAGNLAGLLGSKDPNARASGQSLIDAYLGQRSPQGRANLASTQAGTAQQVQATEHAGIMGPLQERLARAQIATSEATGRAAGVNADAALLAAKNSLAGQLRDDFTDNSQVADFSDTWQSVKQLRASLQNRSAVGAQGAIIKLARIYDPNGVVREGEAAVYRGSMGALNALQNAISAAKGEGFNPQTEADITNLVDDLLESILPGVEAIVDQFTGAALRNGLNPQDVIVRPIDQQDFADWQNRVKARKGQHQWRGLIQRPGNAP